MAADETVTKLIGLFVYHRSRGVDNNAVIPKLYQAHVAQLLLNSNEEVYRLQLLTAHSDLSTGTNASIVACTCLGHLYTPNASTVSDIAKQQELVLEDVEEEEEEESKESPDHVIAGNGEYEVDSLKAVDGHTSDMMLTQDDDEEEEDERTDRSDDDISGAEDGRDDDLEEEDDDEEGETEHVLHDNDIDNMRSNDTSNDVMLQEILNAATKESSSSSISSAVTDEDSKLIQQTQQQSGNSRAKRARR